MTVGTYSRAAYFVATARASTGAARRTTRTGAFAVRTTIQKARASRKIVIAS